MKAKKALVGESNYTEFEILNEFLTTRGFEVSWVKNGRDAVEQFSTVKPDILILDALLPGLTGIKACQQIRQLDGGKDVKTILLSSVYKQFKEKYDNRKTVGVDAYSEKPVDVGSLEKLIASLLRKDDEPADEQDILIEEGGEKSEGISGSFESTPFPKILFFIRKFRRTGALEVDHEMINKVIYVKDGKLTFVSSNQSNESLGRYMVKSEVLSVADYNSSLERMLETGQQHGQVLLDMKLITPHHLFEALQNHMLEKIISIFAWEKGNYSFRGGRLKLENTITIQLDLLDIIHEGIKRFYPLVRLENYYNDYKNHRLIHRKDSMYNRGSLVLKPTEANFLKSINGDLTLGRMVARTKLSLTDTFQLLYFLMLIEEVRFEGDSSMSERSLKSQEEFISQKKTVREELRQGALQTDQEAPSRVVRFRDRISSLFNQLEKLTFFDLLGIPKDAERMMVKAAYHKMVRLYHPSELYTQVNDVTKAKADAIFQTLTKAYEVLADKNEREKYLEELSHRFEAPPSEDTIAPESAVEPDVPVDDIAQESEIPATNIQDEDTEDVFEDSFDFDSVPDDSTSPVDALDPEISWEEQEEKFSGSDSEEEIGFSFDLPTEEPESDEDLEQGRKVTSDMATLVKSELEFQKGEDLLGQKKYDQAKEHFTKAAELNPGEAEYQVYLAWTAFMAAPEDPERTRIAEELLEKATTINPNLDVIYYYKGMIASECNEAEIAKQHFQKALQFNPQNEGALSALDKLENE